MTFINMAKSNTHVVGKQSFEHDHSWKNEKRRENGDVQPSHPLQNRKKIIILKHFLLRQSEPKPTHNNVSTSK